ncbi:MAG: DUF885 domain-containing protein [Bdellovibrionaceae bacterium]|nr:DUF885 domain-containing protein [Pseudobdellovibrionaceae bacterium]
MKLIGFLSIVFLNVSTFAKGSNSSALDACEAQIEKQSKYTDQTKKLNSALDFIWSQWMHESPEWATYIGYPGMDHRWSDRSLAAIQKRKYIPPCHQKLLAQINPKKLNAQNALTLKLIVKKIKSQIKGNEFSSEYLLVDQLGGAHMDIIELMLSAPKLTAQDYENRLARLESYPIYIDQTIEMLEEGLKHKVTPVKFLMEAVPGQFDTVMTKNVKDNPIYKVFTDMPTSIAQDKRHALTTRAENLISQKVVPALAKLKTFIVEKYIPHCRTDISTSSLPNGIQWYNFLVQEHTTTHLTAKEIHELGLAEVARINKDMESVRSQLKFRGSKADFHKFIQTDSQFFYTNPKDLINQYRVISKTIDPELPRLFSKMPELPYGIREMPAYKATTAPTAYYYSGNIKAGRPGYFEANTYNLKSRPKWEMEVLTVHEAVPGHHLQISIAQELGDLPEFRKNEGYTAFVEGWGLYSESLGEEMGLYKDLYSKYGQYSYEMWRAVRLVVDTGMHTMGWSKQKALDYFMENIPKDRLQSENEIDRYITWPGQALAYKVGELKFQELKKRAQEKLQAKFDVREFHKEILSKGALPLDILEEEFNNWLSKKQLSKLN